MSLPRHSCHQLRRTRSTLKYISKTSSRNQCGLNAYASSPSKDWSQPTAMCTNLQDQLHNAVSSLVGQHLCNPPMCDSICTLFRLQVLYQVGAPLRQGVLFRWGGASYNRSKTFSPLTLNFFQRLDITWRTTFGEPARLLTSVCPLLSSFLTK